MQPVAQLVVAHGFAGTSAEYAVRFTGINAEFVQPAVVAAKTVAGAAFAACILIRFLTIEPRIFPPVP